MNNSLKIQHMEHLNNRQSSQLECRVRKVQVCKNIFLNLFLQTSVGVNYILKVTYQQRLKGAASL